MSILARIVADGSVSENLATQCVSRSLSFSYSIIFKADLNIVKICKKKLNIVMTVVLQTAPQRSYFLNWGRWLEYPNMKKDDFTWAATGSIFFLPSLSGDNWSKLNYQNTYDVFRRVYYCQAVARWLICKRKMDKSYRLTYLCTQV